MNKSPETSPSGTTDSLLFDTANERFKKSFGSWFWGSIIFATVAHMALIAYFPDLTASDLSYEMEDFVAIDMPPEVEVPPPPEQIQRPANPVVSDAIIDDDITIAPTTFEDNPPEDLPPPRAMTGTEASEMASRFTTVEVRPQLLNRPAVERALTREYPPLLRDMRVGGTVVMWIQVDEEGNPITVEVREPSEHAPFNQAAERVAWTHRFRPARNRDIPVPVWVSIPITFTVER